MSDFREAPAMIGRSTFRPVRCSGADLFDMAARHPQRFALTSSFPYTDPVYET